MSQAGRYFVHDLDTDQLRIFTGGEADWLALPPTARETIQRACLWSSAHNCWVSRAKADDIWCRSTLTENGFENRGQVGERT